MFATVFQCNDQFQRRILGGGEQHDRSVAHDCPVGRTFQIKFYCFGLVFSFGCIEVHLFGNTSDTSLNVCNHRAENFVLLHFCNYFKSGSYTRQ